MGKLWEYLKKLFTPVTYADTIINATVSGLEKLNDKDKANISIEYFKTPSVRKRVNDIFTELEIVKVISGCIVENNDCVQLILQAQTKTNKFYDINFWPCSEEHKCIIIK